MNDEAPAPHRHAGISETPPTSSELPGIQALRIELERDPGLRRIRADEIWVRARIDEILAEARPRRWQRWLVAAQLLALDAATGTLAWWLLGPEPIADVHSLALSKPLVVALAVAAAHSVVTLGETLRLLRD